MAKIKVPNTPNHTRTSPPRAGGGFAQDGALQGRTLGAPPRVSPNAPLQGKNARPPVKKK
jgi:hypothetical protein